MERERALDILTRTGVTDFNEKFRDKGQMLCTCPLAKWTHKSGSDGKPSCSINYSKTPAVYHCFTCQEKGPLHSLVSTVGSLSGRQDLIDLGMRLQVSDQVTLGDTLDKITQGLDDWYQPTTEVEPVAMMKYEALAHMPKIGMDAMGRLTHFLRSRNVTQAMVDWWDLRHHDYERIVQPVYCREPYEDHLYGAVGRTVVNDSRKYYNYFGMETGRILGGLQHWKGYGRTILVEGFFDMMNIWYWAQCHELDVLCTFGAKVTDEQAKILQELDTHVYLFFDMDDAGIKGAAEGMKKLVNLQSKPRTITWKPKELDMGGCDKLFFTSLLQAENII